MPNGQSITVLLALKKPWIYLVCLGYIVATTFMFTGNPTLPVQVLASSGWAWHHIPEVLSFLFLGMYLGSLGYLSQESYTYHDSFALILLGIVGLGYASVISYLRMFPVVLTLVFIPSFIGYFMKRYHTITKYKKLNTS